MAEAEIAEAVVEAAEGIVGAVLAEAVVRAAEAIVVLVAAVEIAAIANKQQLSMGRSATAPHYFFAANKFRELLRPARLDVTQQPTQFSFSHLTNHERAC
jgi:hypothetical protein